MSRCFLPMPSQPNLPPRMMVPYFMILLPVVCCQPLLLAKESIALLIPVSMVPLKKYPLMFPPHTLDSTILDTKESISSYPRCSDFPPLPSFAEINARTSADGAHVLLRQDIVLALFRSLATLLLLLDEGNLALYFRTLHEFFHFHEGLNSVGKIHAA